MGALAGLGDQVVQCLPVLLTLSHMHSKAVCSKEIKARNNGDEFVAIKGQIYRIHLFLEML